MFYGYVVGRKSSIRYNKGTLDDPQRKAAKKQYLKSDAYGSDVQTVILFCMAHGAGGIKVNRQDTHACASILLSGWSVRSASGLCVRRKDAP
jgi:hypothetical protein